MTGCAGCGGPLPPNKAPGTPRKWCSERCRKASYGDPCGARTAFGAEMARVPEPRCVSCAVEARRVWTRELVIARIREWAAEHGEPPAIPDWNPWMAEHTLHDLERAERFRVAAGAWPSVAAAIRLFGSWNAAIAAAGFTPRRSGRPRSVAV